MRIDVKGRNVAVTDELRERVEKRFEKVAKQVSELARMSVELSEDANPAGKDTHVAEVTLHLKGVTLRARESGPSLNKAISLVHEDIARQVKRHRDKRRGRREARAGAPLPSLGEPVEQPPAAS